MSRKIQSRFIFLFASLSPFIGVVTSSLALSIDYQYPEIPSSDIDLPTCYIQTTNSRFFNLDSLCRKKLEDSVPSSVPTEVPSPMSNGIPSPVPTANPYPVPTGKPLPSQYKSI